MRVTALVVLGLGAVLGCSGSSSGDATPKTGGGDGSPGDIAPTASLDAGAEAGPFDGGVDSAPDTAADGAIVADPACAMIPIASTLTARLRITADNECEVFVNGTPVGMTNNWGAAVTIDVSLYVHPGRKNVIAVRGTNTSSQGGNDRGIIGELTIQGDGGVAALVVTDAAWRVSKTETPGWTAVDFNDAAWVAATEIAKHGDGPWGAILTTSGAKWIWSAPVPVSTADKPNAETAYARRTFYFAADKSVTSKPGCP